MYGEKDTRERVLSIKDLALYIKQHGPFEEPYASLKGKDPQDTWKRYKPEMIAIEAVLTDRIVNRALRGDLANPVGLSSAFIETDENHVDVFKNLKSYTANILFDAYEIEEYKGFSSNDKILQRTWQRYDVLDNFLLHNIRYPSKSGPYDTILKRGLDNSSRVMANVLEVLPYVFEANGHRLDREELTSTAANSFPVIAHLAMLHIADFNEEGKILESGIQDNNHRKYNPDKFTLRKGKNGYALDLKANVKEAIYTALENLPGKLDEQRTGCPGMIDFGYGSVIKKLWNWHISYAPVIYETHLNQQSLEK